MLYGEPLEANESEIFHFMLFYDHTLLRTLARNWVSILQ
jgi:hypothetical protein